MKEEIVDLSTLIPSSYGSTGWALCIGAGTSLDVFKLWNEFAVDVYSTSGLPPIEPKDLEETIGKFGPDALLQAVQNSLDETDGLFADRLSENLYRNIRNLLSTEELTVVEKVFSESYPLSLSPSKVLKKFSVIRDKYFSKTSAFVLARKIVELLETGHGPSEIISFNAEPLFLSLIYSFIFDKNEALFLRGGHTESTIDVITRSISNAKAGKVRFIYLHGLLPINKSMAKTHFSPEKLVFRETEYSTIANSSYSWTSSTFLNIASTRPILFVGMSLSDSNIRKWLSWVQAARREEIAYLGGPSKPSSRHFWIEEKQATPSLERLHTAFVYHLGVRIMWLEDWSRLDVLLDKIF